MDTTAPPTDWMHHDMQCAHRRIGPDRSACDCGFSRSTSIAQTQTLTDTARRAVDRLRDFAREHGMHHFQRDPLVMDIHRALDASNALSARGEAPLPAQPSKEFLAGWSRGFQEALLPDEHPEQDRSLVAWREYVTQEEVVDGDTR